MRDPPYADVLRAGGEPDDVGEGQTPPDQAFLDDWLARTGELVDSTDPELVWFDWWIEATSIQPYLRKFAAYYYNRGADGARVP